MISQTLYWMIFKTCFIAAYITKSIYVEVTCMTTTINPSVQLYKIFN